MKTSARARARLSHKSLGRASTCAVEIPVPAMLACRGFALALRKWLRVVLKRFDEKLHDTTPKLPHGNLMSSVPSKWVPSKSIPK